MLVAGLGIGAILLAALDPIGSDDSVENEFDASEAHDEPSSKIPDGLNGEKEARIDVALWTDSRAFYISRDLWADTDKISWAESLRKGDFIYAWVRLAQDPGTLDNASLILVPSGPYDSVEKAASKR